MRKPFLHVILLFLLAGLNAWAKIPAHLQESYQKALKVYDANDYARAFTLLEPIINVASDDAEASFYFGRAALELKHYVDAEVAFDRVLILEPNHTRSKLELTRLYMETEQFELAQRFLDEALQEPIPLHVKQNLENLKSIVNEKQSRHVLALSLVLGVDYDTNIGNDVGQGVTQTMYGLFPLGGNGQRKSPALFQTALFAHSYDMGERGGLLWESSFMIYNKNLTRYSDKDLLLGSFMSGPTYSFDTHKVSIQGIYERVSLGSEDYLGTHGVSLNFKEIMNASWMLEADITERRNDYVEHDTTDTTSTTYTLGSKYAFTKNDWILSAYARYIQEEENDALSFLSYREKRYSLDLTKELAHNFKSTVGYAYRDLDYTEFDTSFSLKRHDKEHAYSLGFIYSLDPHSSISLQHRYSKHDSNNALYDYAKNVTALSYMRSF